MTPISGLSNWVDTGAIYEDEEREGIDLQRKIKVREKNQHSNFTSFRCP